MKSFKNVVCIFSNRIDSGVAALLLKNQGICFYHNIVHLTEFFKLLFSLLLCDFIISEIFFLMLLINYELLYFRMNIYYIYLRF